MVTRSERTVLSFTKPFTLHGIDGIQPAGDYVVDTDYEPIEGISRLAYRRVGMIIHLPSVSAAAYARQLVSLNQRDLDAAFKMDKDDTI